MTFKLDTTKMKEKSRSKSFRLTHELIEALEKIAKKNDLSVNEVVNQMLQYCVGEYEKKKS